MKTVRSISVASVFKVAAVIYAILFAIFGCLFLVLPGILGAGILGELGEDMGLFGGGIVATLLLWIVGIVLYAIFGGIFAAIGAFVYNLAASWVGGVEVELD